MLTALLCCILFNHVNGFASVNFTALGLTNPDVNLKRMHQLYNVNGDIMLHTMQLCQRLHNVAYYAPM